MAAVLGLIIGVVIGFFYFFIDRGKFLVTVRIRL